jgi:hypothetical protein
MNHSYFDNKPDFKRIDLRAATCILTPAAIGAIAVYLVDSERHQEHFKKGYHEIFASREANGPCECPLIRNGAK